MLSQEKQEGNRGCTERLYQSQHEQEGLERAVAGRLRRGRQQGEERRRLQRKKKMGRERKRRRAAVRHVWFT